MRLYLRALAYFRQDWPLLGTLLLLTGLSTGLGLLMAWPMAILVDSVLAQPARSEWMHRLFLWGLPPGKVGQIVGLAVVGLLMKLLQDILTTAQTIVTNHVNYNGLLRIRCDLFSKLQSLSLTYHKSRPQGEAIYRLSSDTFGCQTILSVLMSLVVAVVTLGVMVNVLGSRNMTLTLLAFAIAPVLAITNIIFGRRLKERSLECKEHDERFTSVVQRTMACIGLVQAFGREEHEFSRFRSSVTSTIRAWWRLNWQQMTYNLIIGATFGIGGAVIFGYGGYLVYRDQYLSPRPGGMTVGDLMIFTSYLGMLWQPLCTITGFSANMQGGVAGAQRVFELLDMDPVIEDEPGAVSLPRRRRAVEFDGVEFDYEPGVAVLKGMSARIEPGQMVAFVGSSGVGKSTLLNLLPRFYDVSAGAVRLDGTDLREIRVRDVRNHVALVLQESVILPTSIAENIAYGRPEATIEDIRRAARLAGAAEFIEQMKDGYQARVAEGGQNLSGGQRQRIGIARAILTGAPILVLDEPTSALDAEHEEQVVSALRGLRGDRTVILVSHRLSTVAGCDCIFVMEDGQVVERGTHETLLAADGLYARMWRQQMQTDDSPEPSPTRISSLIHAAA